MVGATAGLLTIVALLLALLWLGERRRESEREVARAVHRLSEALVAIPTPAGIAERLSRILPAVTNASQVHLYVLQRRTRMLERQGEPPLSVSMDGPVQGFANAALLCFQNRAIVPIPKTNDSPLLKGENPGKIRSAIFVPLVSQGEALGVLEALTEKTRFAVPDTSTLEHIANQVATALKLQEQKLMREQVFHSEKLAATGQLISGVARDLQAPLEKIVKLASATESDELHAEAQHAAEIVTRLASFAGPQEGLHRGVDIQALLHELVKFREPEWRTLALKANLRIPQSPAVVLGTRGQLEQVFLNLLVYGEHQAGKSPSRTLSIESNAIGQRLRVEIKFAEERDPLTPDPLLQDPLEASGGLSVCQGIVRAHGGEIRFVSEDHAARFDVDLPLTEGVPETKSPVARAKHLTLMVVENDPVALEHLLGLAVAGGHRMVPVAAAEAAELAARVRFDAVLWTVRPGAPSWSDAHDRLLSKIPAFVLLSDGYDGAFAASLKESGGFLLARPIRETEFEQVLAEVGNLAV